MSPEELLRPPKMNMNHESPRNKQDHDGVRRRLNGSRHFVNRALHPATERTD